MASKKAGGSAKNLTDSNPQYLGVKLYDGEKAQIGAIIVRQRGTKILAGKNVKVANDHTLFALKDGRVAFDSVRKQNFNGTTTRRKRASVLEA